MCIGGMHLPLTKGIEIEGVGGNSVVLTINIID